MSFLYSINGGVHFEAETAEKALFAINDKMPVPPCAAKTLIQVLEDGAAEAEIEFNGNTAIIRRAKS